MGETTAVEVFYLYPEDIEEGAGERPGWHYRLVKMGGCGVDEGDWLGPYKTHAEAERAGHQHAEREG